MSDKQRRTRRQFTAEFKRDALELVRTSGRPIAVIARELGIYDSTLGNWVRQDRNAAVRCWCGNPPRCPSSPPCHRVLVARR